MASLPHLTKEPTYQKLQEYFNANGNNLNIKALFDSDPARFEKFRLVFHRLLENFFIRMMQRLIRYSQ